MRGVIPESHVCYPRSPKKQQRFRVNLHPINMRGKGHTELHSSSHNATANESPTWSTGES